MILAHEQVLQNISIYLSLPVYSLIFTWNIKDKNIINNQ